MILAGLTGMAIGAINGMVIGNGLERQDNKLKFSLVKGVKETVKNDKAGAILIGAVTLGVLAIADIQYKDEMDERSDLQEELKMKSNEYVEKFVDTDIERTQNNFKRLANTLKDLEPLHVQKASIELFGEQFELSRLEAKGLTAMDDSEIDDFVSQEYYGGLKEKGKEALNKMIDYDSLDNLRKLNEKIDKELNR